MAAPSSAGSSLRPFVATTALLLIVAAMYFARVVVLPVVLAALLAFLLTPVVSWLQRWRVPRVAAALIASLLAFSFFASVIATVVLQFQGLARDLPTHRDEILKKAAAVHRMVSGDWSQNLVNLFDDTVRTVSASAAPSQPAAAAASATSNFWGPIMGWAFMPAVEVGVDIGIVVVLVVFMLAQHEDLRDRIIRLTGTRNVTSTTKALGDGSRRVRRYLMHQFLINCSFGVIVAVGLWLIGVQYPWLWGVLGAALRYVPYIGSWLAAVCPVLLSVAVSDGWTQPLLALGLFALLDLVITNILEPIVYGRSIGVSGTALLIAAVFWTWMWGPIGLILSTPLTACVVVIGHNVDHLDFLSVLLGDQPALSPVLSFYQRLLARDEDQASTVLEEYIQKHGAEQVYDQLLLPALVHTKENRGRATLTEGDEDFVVTATRRLMEDVVYPEQEALNAKEAAADGQEMKCRLLILGCPAKDDEDEIALEMLRRLLPAGRCQMDLLSKEALAGEVLARVDQARPPVIVIGATAPYSFSAIRYLCKRLRARAPDVKILVGCWGLRDDVSQTVSRLKAAGADLASAELLETRGLLLPLIREAALRRAAEERHTTAPVPAP